MVNSETAQAKGPLERIIAFSAQQRWLVIALIIACAAWGYRSLINSPLDAVPDLSDVQVIVFTDWPGRSPDLVEDQITYPLTTTLLAAPKVQFVRGQSFMGLSFIYVIFEDDTDMYWARSRVLEYLNTASTKLPKGVSPSLGPDATGVGWVYQYALKDHSGQYDLAELRSLQDFNLRYAIESVKGVAEVASVGGFVKEYHINIDPIKLAAYNIPLSKVSTAVQASNSDVGGRVLEISGHEQFIRGRGYVKNPKDLEEVVIGLGQGGTPIRIADVAQVSLGPALQRGQADLDGEGITVGGIVVMRYGENALDLIKRVKQRIAQLQQNLPDGVEIVAVYDRATLIEDAITTLKDTLIEEMLIVSLVIGLFLLHVRSALVAIITLPIAVLLSFIPMYYQGLSANIMSLGGIAVAIGAMVDAAIVIIDNIHKRLHAQAALSAGDNELDPKTRTRVMIEAMQEVGPSIFYSLLIITISFAPVFALEGSEGRLFKPLAFSKTYSMLFAALLSISLIPALAMLLIKGRIKGEQSWLNRQLRKGYARVLGTVLRWRWPVVIIATLSMVAIAPLYSVLGKEFMPPLNEGSILYMPTTLPGISIEEATRVMQTMDRELKKFPEVERVFGKVGRSTSPTDPAPLSMIETNIMLKPKSEWREDMDWDTLISEMDKAMRFPGMPNMWWMPIQTRTEMLATGIRSTLGVKVFGPDLELLEKTAVDIEQALMADPRTKPYTRSAFAERTRGGYFLDFDINREAAARFGLNVGDIQTVIETALGGKKISETVEGRERYDILLRYDRNYRDTEEALERVFLNTPGGAQIPIRQVADIVFRTGPPALRNEDGQLVSFVFVDTNELLGIADYVEVARQVVAERVDIPPAYRIEWAGQFTYFERAKARLSVLVPLTVLVIFLMLYLHRKSFIETLLIMTALPFSAIGSLSVLFALGYKLSVAVAVGMIAVAGLAVEMSLLMMLYLDLAWRRQGASAEQPAAKASLSDAIVQGASQRIRPMLMTGITLLIGLLPIMASSGSGADVMKRIAAPMLGGAGAALILALIVLPAAFSLWKERESELKQ